jgi:hypothetical protein
MTHKRVPATERAALEAALFDHHTLSRRSEGHEAFGTLFINTGHAQMLDTPDWQVIYGSKGAGKTMLLKALHHGSKTGLASSGVLTLYISAHDVLASPIVTRAADDRQRAHGYFHAFMERFGEELVARSRGLRRGTTFREKRRDAKTQREVEDRVRDILDLVEGTRTLAAYSETSAAHETEDVADEERSADLGAGAKLDRHGAGFDLHAGGGRSRSSKRSARDASARSGPLVPRYAEVRDRLVELVALLELRRIDILVDEWSALDPSGSSAVQPMFADLLRRTFWGAKAVSVKIATNQYQTRFSDTVDGVARGLQLDDHITEEVTLDRPLLDDARERRFFEYVLFRRLFLVNGKLEQLAQQRSHDPGPDFLNALFADPAAFEELVRGAEGNPRRFIEIFRRLAQRSTWELEEPWDVDAVQAAIRDASVLILAESDYPAQDEAFLPLAEDFLVDCVKPVVTRNGNAVFLVERVDSRQPRVADALADLRDRQLILDDDVGLPDGAPGRYSAYHVTYGVWLDWQRPLRAAGSAPSVETERVREIARSEITEYVVDITPMIGNGNNE